MEDRNGVIVRNSMLDAISTLINSKGDKYPYDKTFIGRIKKIRGLNLYDISINGRVYEKIKGIPFINFKINDIVFCIAPQSNLNQLRAIISIDRLLDVNIDNLTANKINIDDLTANKINIDNLSLKSLLSDSGSIKELNGDNLTYTNASFTSLLLNSKNVEGIEEKGDNFIRYTSGLQIDFWRQSFNNIQTINFPKSFLSGTQPIVMITQEANARWYGNMKAFSITNVNFKIDSEGSTSAGFFVIGYWK